MTYDEALTANDDGALLKRLIAHLSACSDVTPRRIGLGGEGQAYIGHVWLPLAEPVELESGAPVEGVSR